MRAALQLPAQLLAALARLQLIVGSGALLHVAPLASESALELAIAPAAAALSSSRQTVPSCDSTPAEIAARTNATLAALRAQGYTIRAGQFEVQRSSAFGANPGNPYVVYKLPLPLFRLGAGAAVLFVGCTPPPCAYFSYRSYLFTDGAEILFASLGDSLNNLVVNTSGDHRDVHSHTLALVTTGDRVTFGHVATALAGAGLGAATNLDAFAPSNVPEPRLATFMMLHRASVWKDEQQRAAYFAQSRAVYLLTPPSTQPVVALPRKADRPRGTGVPESAALPASPAVLLQQLRRGVEARLSSLPGRRLALSDLQNTSNRALYGLECIANHTDCLGDNHDTDYIHSTSRSLGERDVLVVVGTNCVRNNKCTYSNVGLYTKSARGRLLSTPLTADNRSFNGSAAFFAPLLEPAAAAERLFVLAFARNCSGLGETHCVTTNTSLVAVNANAFVVYRTVLEAATRTGPLVTELVLPQLMHFKA